MTPVFWTEAALAHLAAIRDYIGQTSPVYAGRMIDCILARGTQLTHFPNSGRHVLERPDPLLREVLEGPYRVIYRVRPDRVEVLAIVHGRRADVGPLKSSE